MVPDFARPPAPAARYSTPMRRPLSLALILLASILAAADKKPPTVPLLLRPNQAVQIDGLKVPPPVQKCENWGWAAGLELMLRLQGVDLDQRYWVTKVDGGELCMPQLRPLEELAGFVDGEYLLDVGHKVRLKARYTKGAPTVPDDMIVSLREGSPWLFFWKGHPYLMIGLSYDEYVGPNNARIFQLKEIKLLDLLTTEDDPKRQVSFVRGRDDAADIDGTMRVQALPIE